MVQTIPNPASLKAQNAFQNEQVVQSYLHKQLTEKELRLQVQQGYLDLQQRKALQGLYERLIQTYEHYFDIAEVRVDVGESNRIELLTIQSSLNEYRLLLNQTNLEIGNLEKQLATLLNTNENITSSDNLMVIPFELGDSINAVQVEIAHQNIQIEQANIELLKAQMKPDFNIGYAVQKYFDGGWLNGFQAGIQIPLFNQQTKQKVRAQKIQVDVSKANLEIERLRIKQQLLSIENAVQMYAAGVDFYQEQLDMLNPEMERISELNYQAGEISYLELLNTLNLLSKNNKQYLDQVLFHNKTVVLYQFFSNQ